MWQEVLAVDSRLCAARKMDKELRPLYLKRRMQLIKAAEDEYEASQLGQSSELGGGGGGGPIRNKRYISLRVKLLKRQFGLPSDVLSLKSLSLSKDANDNTSGGNKSDHVVTPQAAAEQNRFSFGGVKHIYDQHSDAVTTVRFAHNDDSTLVAASADGRISVCQLRDGSGSEFTSLEGHKDSAVLDLDVSESNEFLVSCSADGVVALWDLKTKELLRKTDSDGSGLVCLFCRFLPKNNNLVVCGVNSGAVRLFNVSTGKFVAHVSSPVLGKSLCAEVNHLGSVLWVGSDRGYIESFRLVDAKGISGRVAKGCRVQADPKRPVAALSYRSSLSKVTRNPCLMVGFSGSRELRMFRVKDEFGTVEPFMSITAPSPLRSSVVAPLLSFNEGTCVAAGAEDGTVLLFDLSRPPPNTVANKLLGHARPVTAVAFSPGERFLATADTAGQIIVWKK